MRFFIFIVCLFCGIISGILYDVLFVARVFLCGADKRVYTVKDRIFIIAADILYCLTFAAGYIFTSVTFDFEGFRLYMLIGCGLGALLYLKSFQVIVAFSVKKVYNKLNLYLEKKGGRSEEKPHRRGDNGKRNTFNNNSRRRDNLSAKRDNLRKKSGGRNKKRNRPLRAIIARQKARP